jgi:enamine deaminase RidA (YjgF/YER057c/UK114 family)
MDQSYGKRAMKRTAINPWSWAKKFGFNQAECVEGSTRVLHCSGQCAMNHEGMPRHDGDMRGQIELAYDNLEAVLHAADMTLANVVSIVTYTTDVDTYLAAYGRIAVRLSAAGIAPAQTMIGVSRLFLPQLMVEVQATAIA